MAVAVSGNYLFVAHYLESTNLANNWVALDNIISTPGPS
jgi:hypothetical protein